MIPADDEERIGERVRAYAGALHQRALERVMREAKLKGLDWIGPHWVESSYAREVERLLHEGV